MQITRKHSTKTPGLSVVLGESGDGFCVAFLSGGEITEEKMYARYSDALADYYHRVHEGTKQ